ncbi:MAG: hypothetical protein MK193_13550 [Lentisphaeria bacterium]|nr:hypothetical protein [Lentisphaeria bacterium]
MVKLFTIFFSYCLILTSSFAQERTVKDINKEIGEAREEMYKILKEDGKYTEYTELLKAQQDTTKALKKLRLKTLIEKSQEAADLIKERTDNEVAMRAAMRQKNYDNVKELRKKNAEINKKINQINKKIKINKEEPIVAASKAQSEALKALRDYQKKLNEEIPLYKELNEIIISLQKEKNDLFK